MQNIGPRRIAIVVPRFGDDIRGGAEKLAAAYARHLAPFFEVDILTTCARDYRTWKNVYEPGPTVAQGFTIRRFRVAAPRNIKAFDRLSRALAFRAGSLSAGEQREWMQAQGPDTPELLEYLQSHAAVYQAVLFLPYLYATTYFGLPVVADRAVLVPLAHDEWPIYMSSWDSIFGSAAAAIYVTEQERGFVQRRFGPNARDGPVVLAGIDRMAGDASRFRSKYLPKGSFALYLGRVDESKGCLALAEDFGALRKHVPFPQNLVFIGPLHMNLRPQEGILVCGEVDEQTKWDALNACDLLIMPSRYESLSFAVLEAWSEGKPVLVNAGSAVLVEHCRRSNGGLWYSSRSELKIILELLTPDLRHSLGAQGRAYLEQTFDWGRSMQTVREIIESVAAS